MTFSRSFRGTCNVLAHISQMKHFWPWHVIDKIVENSISFKLSFGWEISDVPCGSYGRSSSVDLFLKNPNLEAQVLDDSGAFLDESGSNFDQMVNDTSK